MAVTDYPNREEIGPHARGCNQSLQGLTWFLIEPFWSSLLALTTKFMPLVDERFVILAAVRHLLRQPNFARVRHCTAQALLLQQETHYPVGACIPERLCVKS